ncbi:unnamed protein product [Macrosiphum euphorbiae]|uniref:Uncharacterized protein n=1 Tax=Macrosiphum euphorbiae TaxID=13131 RepID=A0AAV0XK89_9HEMI|nr:unnamed protein product [Macrosiphum euphorbiae]
MQRNVATCHIVTSWSLPRVCMKNYGTGVVLCAQGSTGSFGDLMNLKRFYDDSSVGSAENLVARAVPLSTVFCRQHLGAASEESVSSAAAEAAASGPYHHRSRIDLQQKQLQQAQQQQQLQLQHQQQHQQQTRRYASELGGARQQPPQHRTAEMTSQQRIERMSRIMKQQNHRPEQMMRFRHTVTLVSGRHHNVVIKYFAHNIIIYCTFGG